METMEAKRMQATFAAAGIARLVGCMMLLLAASLSVASGCRTLRPDSRSDVPVNDLARLPAADGTRSIDAAAATKSRCDILMALALNQERHEQFAAAISTYERVLEHDAHHATALHRLALAHDRQGNHKQAARYFAECGTVVGEDPDLLADLGYRAYLHQEWQAAEDFFQRGLATGRVSARLHNNYALLLTQREQYPRAIEEFCAGGCSRSEAYSNVGHLCVLAERWDEAHQFLTTAVEQPHRCKQAYATLAQLWPEGYEGRPIPHENALAAFETSTAQR